MRAAIYARYSSENQRPESIEDQIGACLRLARERGLRVLEDHGNNRARAARHLGISRSALYKRLEKLGLS